MNRPTTAHQPPVFRLFVSSTFGDMKAEREILQARVFPKLRDYGKSKGAVFQAVDLRCPLCAKPLQFNPFIVGKPD